MDGLRRARRGVARARSAAVQVVGQEPRRGPRRVFFLEPPPKAAAVLLRAWAV